MPDEWIEKGLVAEAARQRQLEDFNYRAGTLDFDGVDPELGMHLLSLHWNRQHHSFLLTYRPAFMRDMACGGPYFSKILLNAIYFGASKFSPRREVRRNPSDVRTAGWAFRERVRKLLGDALDSSDITTIQALLVMTNSLFALGDERSAAWLYAGLAFRMIIDLGMHVDAPGLGITRKFSDEDLEIRRRVFWGAFVVDKIQSLYQGRPASLKESDTLVPIKFLDTFEEFENWAPFAYSAQNNSYPGSPAYSVSTFTHLCRLSVVMSDILSCIYTERAFDKSPQELSTMLENLSSKLAAWKDALPTHLIFDPKSNTKVPPPHVLSLHAMYHVLTILLHRPFVADGHLYNTSRSMSINSFITCASAADSIVSVLRVYDKSFVRGQDFTSVPMETGQPETQLQVTPQTMSNQQPGGDLASGVGNQSWIQGLPEADAGAASFDDLLFGFNGSALDSFF
ncbi:putative transcriptional regulatory protein [Colletotrichum siamense]|uniref:putative transcriptional regulatory protein n=1 Tax=Colletotrichum siamense TaxID=690259 RepID=UPI0018725ADC|nr:putative transcriptional regulatory protein [Colletotrichum siamense]KAF5486622.1 putative transcriptional regulatory protein [Colletotrichum siamense]